MRHPTRQRVLKDIGGLLRRQNIYPAHSFPTSLAGTRPFTISLVRQTSRLPGSGRPSRVVRKDTRSKERQEVGIHAKKSDSTTQYDDSIDNHTSATRQSTPPNTLHPETSSRPVLDHATIEVTHSNKDVITSSTDKALMTGIESILGQPSMVVTRELEMMNVFMGFEQANRYSIVTPEGQQIGYLAERETGMLGGTMKRQFLRTHRPFEAHILDTAGNVVLSIKRPFTFINSRAQVFVGNADDGKQLVGEVQQIWHPWRRKYELFVHRNGEMVQFANIDGGLWAWEFVMTDESSRPLGAISRNFRGLGRELFTDTGQYVLTFDPTNSPDLRLEAPQTQQGASTSSTELVQSGPARALSLDERAVALATAISADFDYFSRHSEHSHGGMMPFFWMPGSSAGGSPSPEGSHPPDVEQQPASDAQQPVDHGHQETHEQSHDTPMDSQQWGTQDPNAGSWWDGNTDGEEQVWGKEEPWQADQGSEGSGWSLSDFFPGSSDE